VVLLDRFGQRALLYTVGSVANQSDERKSYKAVLHTPTGESTVEVAENEHIWDAAARQGVKLPATCHQGWCLTCAAELEQGTTDQQDSFAYFPEDREAHFALLCTGKPGSDLVIRTHQATAMRKHRLRHHLPSPSSFGLVP
jgi:ferredoxin